MNKISIFLLITLLFTSCTTVKTNKTTNENADITTVEEVPVDFTVEKVTLSQGFQTLKPNVEILKNEDKASLLINLGIVECSQIVVEKITTFNDELNIYVAKTGEGEENKLVVPQLIINLEQFSPKDLNNKKFNIINTNYEPIKISYAVNHALNNINAQYKVDVNTTPHIKLIKENNKLYWDISLHNIYDRDILGNPLVNLKAKIDTETGETIDGGKEVISEYIDEGEILHVTRDNIIFYKQTTSQEDELYETLWLYDGAKRKKLYTTHNQIYTINYNPDFEAIALVEHDNGITNVYLICLKDFTVQKITPIDYNHIWLVEWDNEKLILVNNDKDNISTFFEYNLSTKNMQKLSSVNMNISSFDIKGNLFVINQFDNTKGNTDIYFTQDGVNLYSIDVGGKSSFLNKDNIVYLRKDEEMGKNLLWLYNINTSERKIVTDLNMNVINYYVYDENHIITVCVDNNSSEFSVYKHLIEDDITVTKIAQTVSKDVYYNNEGFIYINSIPPSKEENEYNIYKIDLSKVSLE